jgi:hypothetical protein
MVSGKEVQVIPEMTTAYIESVLNVILNYTKIYSGENIKADIDNI